MRENDFKKAQFKLRLLYEQVSREKDKRNSVVKIFHKNGLMSGAWEHRQIAAIRLIQQQLEDMHMQENNEQSGNHPLTLFNQRFRNI